MGKSENVGRGKMMQYSSFQTKDFKPKSDVIKCAFAEKQLWQQSGTWNWEN
jgi:hypothetical protein